MITTKTINILFMKQLHLFKLATIIIAYFMLVSCSSENNEEGAIKSNKAIIKVMQAGSLAELISDDAISQIEELTLSGFLNGSDILFLKELNNNLIKLDLSDAQIVEGGEPYAIVTEKYYTKKDEISDYFFSAYAFNKLETILLPKNCTHIGKYALANLTKLSFVKLPNKLKDINSAAFYNCLSLKSIILPESVQEIGDNSFQNCQELTSIQFNTSLQKIGIASFLDCKSLITIELPSSLKTIGLSIFQGCSSLSSVTISDGLTTITAASFKDCTSLSNISLPNSLNSIEFSAFEGCSSLQTITIPQNVNEISFYVFKNCASLREIHLKATSPPNFTIWSDENVNSYCTLFVPKGSLDTYKKTNSWSLFNHIIEE